MGRDVLGPAAGATGYRVSMLNHAILVNTFCLYVLVDFHFPFLRYSCRSWPFLSPELFQAGLLWGRRFVGFRHVEELGCDLSIATYFEESLDEPKVCCLPMYVARVTSARTINMGQHRVAPVCKSRQPWESSVMRSVKPEQSKQGRSARPLNFPSEKLP